MNKSVFKYLSGIIIPMIFATSNTNAQQSGTGQMNSQNFPAAVSSSKNVIHLNMKDYITAETPTSSEVEIMRNVVYVNRDGVELILHILYPKGAVSSLPCIVHVPGSAWMEQNMTANIPNLTKVAARGYVVASVQYRHSRIAVFPAQMQDAKTAIRFMRKNATQYHVDTRNIFIWGDSSGGHTAMFAGFTQANQELDTDVYSEYSEKVNAVVNYYGPTELAKMSDYPSLMDHSLATSPEGLLIGGAIPDHPERARKASPVYYVTSNVVPIFIAHGNRDTLVPLNQSDLLAEALDKAGTYYEYYCLLDSGHGGPEFWTNEMLDKVMNFIQKYTVK